MVEVGAAVEDDDRRAGADLAVEQPGAVDIDGALLGRSGVGWGAW